LWGQASSPAAGLLAGVLQTAYQLKAIQDSRKRAYKEAQNEAIRLLKLSPSNMR
jgi:hypothetical protein